MQLLLQTLVAGSFCWFVVSRFRRYAYLLLHAQDLIEGALTGCLRQPVRKLFLIAATCVISFNVMPTIRSADGELRAQEARSQPTDTINAVFQAWRARQQRIKTARVKVKVSRTMSAGYLNNVTELVTRKEGMVRNEALTYEAIEELVYDGLRMKHTYNGPLWSIDEGKLENHSSVSAFNGKELRTFQRIDQAKQPLQGFIENEQQLDIQSYRHFAPLFWLLQPMNTMLGRSARSDFILEAPVPDRRADEFVFVNEELLLKISVGEAPFYVIKNCSRLLEENDGWQIDVDYRTDPEFGRLPRSWKVVSLADGGKDTMDCEVLTVDLNQEIDPATFNVEFPPGTVVLDRRQPGTRVVKAREDGVLEPLLVSENASSIRRPIVVLNIVVVVLLIALITWKRLRPRETMRHPK